MGIVVLKFGGTAVASNKTRLSVVKKIKEASGDGDIFNIIDPSVQALSG